MLRKPLKHLYFILTEIFEYIEDRDVPLFIFQVGYFQEFPRINYFCVADQNVFCYSFLFQALPSCLADDNTLFAYLDKLFSLLITIFCCLFFRLL